MITRARRRRRPLGLVGRISLLVAVACGITAVLGLIVAITLIRPASESSAQTNLARLADVSARQSDQLGQARVRETLQAIRIQSATVDSGGQVRTGSSLARGALTSGRIQTLLGGNPVSATIVVGDQTLLLEARPTNIGGIALVQRRSDATAGATAAIERMFWALVVATAIAVTIGALSTRRLVQPLRRTAAAAHALAGGRRDVAVVLEGPPEIAEVASALNALNTALGRSEGRQRDFLLSVSHDLRTPLTAIMGYAESLQTGVVPPAQAPEVATAISSESARLNRMIADLLSLARLGDADFSLEVGPVDLTSLLGAAAVVWSARCARAGLRFSAESPPFAVITVTDAARLRQLLDGLLENAVRVTPSGAPIVLALRPEPGAAVIDVRDGGPGLQPEDLPVAFDRGVLHQRYRGRRAVGTGLGLAIVKALADRLGATVEAGRSPEGGAMFTVRLPLGS